MPEDLSYLPLIESAFSLKAYSRARAHGMWQFISSTGRYYDLEIGSLIDERRDPVRSTEAAVAYLSDLHDQFSDWYLALAAYNSGAGNVRRPVRRRCRGRRRPQSSFGPDRLLLELTDLGTDVEQSWKWLYERYDYVDLDSYTIMPNHFHGLIKLNECRERFVTICGKNEKTNRTNHGLPEIIRGFKTFSSKTINKKNEPEQKFRWQKSYHDRIIRNEYELNNVRKYILDNPINWEYDKNNPSNVDL